MEPKISVIMSIYNESFEEIKEAIDSIIHQSFDEFECIIINDNPEGKKKCDRLCKYIEHDKRFRIFYNSNNIGLAMSMNRAASYARSDILVRMDADDIAYPDRFRSQYKIIKDGKYDVVCSRYICIDEKGKQIREFDTRSTYAEGRKIETCLPIKSYIHHPTVMMNKKNFDNVKGYRDFPCAQDYDLWLRLLEDGAKFVMIDEPLLKYRIRENSISKKRQIRQKLTIEYIRELYIQRLRHGIDRYSKENYEGYIKRYLRNESKQSELIFSGNIKILQANKYITNGDLVKGSLLKLQVLAMNSVYRHLYSRLLYCKVRIKLFSNKQK